MKKTLFSTMLLLGMVGAGATGLSTTASAADTADATTNMTMNVTSGGMAIETVAALDFDSVKIGNSVNKTQAVKVTNLTGKPNVNLNAKLDTAMPTGLTLASMGTGDNGKTMTTTATPVVGTAKPAPVDGVSNYNFDWKVTAGTNATTTSTPLTKTMTFTASPII